MKKNEDQYNGVIVPMVTPVTKKGEIDRPSSEKLINHLLDRNTIPFILGTTGEGPSVPLNERRDLVKILIENRREDVPLIAGVMGLTYHDTIDESNRYLDMGADAIVLTLPNYFILTDKQIMGYFEALSDKISGNIILYNIPKAVNMSIPVTVIDHLSDRENVIGIKDSELDEKRLEASLNLWKGRSDFFHLTGVNKLMIKGLQLGSNGIVPGTGNILPELYTEMVESVKTGQMDRAWSLFRKTEDLGKIYQGERNLGESLAALKTIMAFLGFCSPFVLPPLTATVQGDSERIIENFEEQIKDQSLSKFNSTKD